MNIYATLMAERVLKAQGTALKNYMPHNQEKIVQAMAEVIKDAYQAGFLECRETAYNRAEDYPNVWAVAHRPVYVPECGKDNHLPVVVDTCKQLEASIRCLVPEWIYMQDGQGE